MLRARLSILLLFLLTTTLLSQDFSPQQKAWLYKIVRKTQVLRQNWGSYFIYTGGIPERIKVNNVVNGRGQIYYVSMWDSIENSIRQNPELLEVDWTAVSKTSPGLIANASVKLALWELYSNIRAGYEQQPPFSVNKEVKVIYNEMLEALPETMRKGGEIKPKYLPAFYDVINPSHSVRSKFAAVEEHGKIKPQEKRKLFDRWHQLVGNHVAQKSQEYFNVLIKRKAFFKGELLAVGDGSGSSGLLGELEDKEGDKEINTGTGKGIGLFTYKMKLKSSKVVPDYVSDIKLKLLEDEPTLLHLSLWGMDWQKYPTVVVENGNKSYVLIGTPSFSPDPSKVEGTSYFDRMEDYKKRKIDNVVDELNKEGGLYSVYKREEKIRGQIRFRIDSINAEIDTLRKYNLLTDAGYENRKLKNDVNLSNLTDKERRLKDLQRKIGAEYAKIDKAEKELAKMKAALGKNPQAWKKRDSVYVFEDGTVFNYKTQDLILFDDSLASEDLQVKLLAATYSVFRDSKDEVQLYVNVTGGVEEYLKELEKNKQSRFMPDTLLKGTCLFEPNQFKVHEHLLSLDEDTLRSISKGLRDKTVEINLLAMGIDTQNHPDISSDKKNYAANYQKGRYKKSRRVEIEIVEQSESIQINVRGYADAGNTRLLSLLRSPGDFVSLAKSEQSLNPYLSALRVMSAICWLEKSLGYTFRKTDIWLEPLNKAVSGQFLMKRFNLDRLTINPCPDM